MITIHIYSINPKLEDDYRWCQCCGSDSRKEPGATFFGIEVQGFIFSTTIFLCGPCNRNLEEELFKVNRKLPYS